MHAPKSAIRNFGTVLTTMTGETLNAESVHLFNLFSTYSYRKGSISIGTFLVFKLAGDEH